MQHSRCQPKPCQEQRRDAKSKNVNDEEWLLNRYEHQRVWSTKTKVQKEARLSEERHHKQHPSAEFSYLHFPTSTPNHETRQSHKQRFLVAKDRHDPDSNNVESASYDPPFPACHAGFLAAGPRDHVLRIAVAMTESTLHRKLGVEIVC